jgi:hypothetical protein
MMNYEWRKAIDEMRRDGYAVVIMSPDELGPISPQDAEDWMIDCINQNIEIVENDNDNT